MGGVDGLISGLPTTDLIDSMIEASSGANRVIERKKEIFELRLESVRSLNTRLLSARLDTSTLKRASTYTSRVASTSDDGVLKATAQSNAVSGTYSLTVNNIARAHQLATQGQANDSEIIGSGDIILQLGNGTQNTISVANASLQDIAAAINAEDMGLTASVINDGQTNPYRLIIQSNETGSENAITVSGTADLVNLMDQSQMNELSEALDAEVSFGAGAGAITVSSSTNTLDELIAGVSIDLVAAGTVNINVDTDTSGAETAITTFIESLNSALEYFDTNSSYDSETNEAGILFSENGLRRSIEELSRTLISPIEGLPDDLRTFASIGISVNRASGLFDIDTSVLQSQLAANPDGVADLFLNRGSSSNTSVEFAAMSSKTDVNATFAIDITTAASKAVVGSLADLDASTIITGANSDLAFTINGSTFSVSLAEGTYTRNEMADHLEQVINAAVDSKGSQVEVSLNGDALKVQSKFYGARQSISFSSSTGQAGLKISTTAVTGADVAGTINGTAATGTGQILRGVDGEGSEGLRLVVTANVPISGITLDVFEGLGQRLSSALDSLVDVDSGVVTIKEDVLTQGILDFEDSIASVNERLDLRRQRLQSKFLQMEKLLSQFQGQERFLQSQIAGFQNLAASRASG